MPCSTTLLRRHGFTLVELAIVLAIVGILVGGILVGRSVLNQSELQTVVSDYTKYTNAFTQFNQQYGGLPGDILDATNYFGDDTTYCTDPAVTSAGTGTCNGDNDGQVLTANGSATIPNINEPIRAWQHLQLANYLKGNLTGVPTATGLDATIGTNVPRSRISNAGWSFYYKGLTSGNATYYDQDIGNFLMFGSAVTGAQTRGAALTPTEAWQLDKKMDDSIPSTGRIVAVKPAALANCTLNPGPADANATYNITNTSIACNLNLSLTTK